MTAPVWLEIATLFLLAGWFLLACRANGQSRSRTFHLALCCCAGAALAMITISGQSIETGWPRSASFSLWLSALATTLLFLLLSAVTNRLHPSMRHVAGFVLLASICSLVLHHLVTPDGDMARGPRPAMIDMVTHIIPGLLSYALVTLAAINGVSTGGLTRQLKRRTTMDSDRVLVTARATTHRLLVAAAIILIVGIVSGYSRAALSETGIKLDHKSLFSLAALFTIALLLLLNRMAGLGGRTVTRLVFFCFLLLTLAYPGVKIVLDIVLAKG